MRSEQPAQARRRHAVLHCLLKTATVVREGAVDDWSRFQGASAAIGHYVRLVHDGRLDPFAGWEAICGYNAAMRRPSWPLDRLMAESERLWTLHVKRNGPPLLRTAHVDAAAQPDA